MSKKNEKKENNIERKVLIFLVLSVILVALICIFTMPTSKNEIWMQVGNEVTKGDEKYKIGEYYEYDESGNGEIKNLTDVKWKVLGVDSKGKLLIVSASSVETITLGKKDDIKKTMDDYETAKDEMNKIAEKYGRNVAASSARSISGEDIHKITEYNVNQMNNYGNEYTYYWGNSENPFVKVEDEDVKNLQVAHNSKFIWYNRDTRKWITSEKEEGKEYKKLEKITTIENELVMYSNAYYDQEFNEKNYLQEESLEYKMIFQEDNGEKANYWVSDKIINATEKYVGYGYNVVRGSDFNYSNLLYSSGNIFEITAGVRVVITID